MRENVHAVTVWFGPTDWNTGFSSSSTWRWLHVIQAQHQGNHLAGYYWNSVCIFENQLPTVSSHNAVSHSLFSPSFLQQCYRRGVWRNHFPSWAYRVELSNAITSIKISQKKPFSSQRKSGFYTWLSCSNRSRIGVPHVNLHSGVWLGLVSVTSRVLWLARKILLLPTALRRAASRHCEG